MADEVEAEPGLEALTVKAFALAAERVAIPNRIRKADLIALIEQA